MPKLETITRRLAREVDALEFGEPVTHVYNPLVHAWKSHREYLRRYGDKPKRQLFLGMNPGPFGMAQTGVPFGDIPSVRDWMGISEKVASPKNPHPKRPIEGFDCERVEVSGQRLWGWAAETCGTPKRFFRHSFIHNYCPLVFMEESGRNRTPDKLPVDEREPLFEICDRALEAVVVELEVEIVIGVGAFAEQCAKRVLAEHEIAIHRILHPSPASPIANRGWAEAADRQMEKAGLSLL